MAGAWESIGKQASSGHLNSAAMETPRGGDPRAKAEGLRETAMGREGSELQVEQGTCKAPMVG